MTEANGGTTGPANRCFSRRYFLAGGLAAGLTGLGWRLSRPDQPVGAAVMIDPAVADRLTRAVVRVAPDQADGGEWGVLFDADARLVATPAAPLKDRAEVPVSFDPPGHDGTSFDTTGKVVFRDTDRGLTLLRVERLPEWASAPLFGDGPLPVGQPLYTLGPDGPDGREVQRQQIQYVLQPPHY